MRIGIVIALEAEARTLAHRDGDFFVQGAARYHYQTLVSGPGPRRADAAARQLLATGCDALLSFGLAGGLAPALHPGALIVATSVHTSNGEALNCDRSLHDALLRSLKASGARSASLYGADTPIVTHADKRALYETLGVAAVDMESAAIGRAAGEASCPFAVLRCVVDPAHFTLPRAALAGMAEDGSNRPLATAAVVLMHPFELPDLIRLALWYGGALRTLRGAGALLCG